MCADASWKALVAKAANLPPQRPDAPTVEPALDVALEPEPGTGTVDDRVEKLTVQWEVGRPAVTVDLAEHPRMVEAESPVEVSVFAFRGIEHAFSVITPPIGQLAGTEVKAQVAVLDEREP